MNNNLAVVASQIPMEAVHDMLKYRADVILFENVLRS